MASPADFDHTSPEVLACPFPFWATLRAQDPVHQLPDGSYAIARYDDVLEATKQPTVFSNHRATFGAGDPELEAIAMRGYPRVDTLTTNDPPVHTRYRKLVNRSFTNRAVATMEPSVRGVVDGIIDDFIDRGTVEFVTELADLVPAFVIADALGVPRDGFADFKRWSDDIVDSLFSIMSRERQLECAESYVEFQRYFADRIEERRAAPGTDLVSQLVTSSIDGERPLDVPEILDLVRVFLVAGNETTAALLAGAMLLLLDHPDQFKEILDDRSLIPPMLEEAVRLVAPALWQPRTIEGEEGVTIAGVHIPAGSRARLLWGSANRDEAHFDDSDRFDIHRDNSEHIAYGHGTHFCLGAPLARLEARVAFEQLLARTEGIRLTVPRDEVRTLPHAMVRRVNALPLSFRRAEHRTPHPADR